MQAEQVNWGEADLIARTAAAVRALFVIYKTSLAYPIDHPVFTRSVDEYMPVILSAVKGGKDLELSFIKGQVRIGTLLLDPGSVVFQTIANTFETRGISGFAIRPGVSATEVAALVKVMTVNADEIAKGGFQNVLKREGIKNIVERKFKLDLEGKAKTEGPGEKDQKSASTIKPRPSPSQIFEIQGMDFGGKPAGPEPAFDKAAERKKPFREFVTGVVAGISQKKMSMTEFADAISTEYEERLGEKEKEFQQEKARIVRRLDNVKNLVFAELEELKVTALMVDTKRNILATTSAARKLLGNISQIPPDSPLAIGIEPETTEVREIMIGGQKKYVHGLASESSANGEVVMLIVLADKREIT